MVGPGRSVDTDDEVRAVRELLDKELNVNLSWFSFPDEMFDLQMVSTLSAIELGGNFATLYARVISPKLPKRTYHGHRG